MGTFPDIRNKLSKRLTFLIEYLDLPAATNDPDAQWEKFQIEQLNYDGDFFIIDKSRQVGFSWTSAAEAVAIASMEPRSTIIFGSINQSEAREKIRYAHYVIEALDRQVRPHLIIDNMQELEFENGSRIISHPATPIRGKAKAYVYLDEFAHVQKDLLIYESAIPVVTRGGKIRIGSSPMGESGMFWEIFTQRMRQYPEYHRMRVPWFHLKSLCHNVPEAIRMEHELSTEEMVLRFGNNRIQAIFDSLPLESFEQEYACKWVDESVAWITWSEIKRNQQSDSELPIWVARSVDEAIQQIDSLAYQYNRGLISGELYGGYDVGRKKNLSEFIALAETPDGKAPYRMGFSLDRVEFEDQKRVLSHALEHLPLQKLYIDSMGLGMELAEDLEKAWSSKIEPAIFTSDTKEAWATKMKVKFQRAELPIPLDRDLAYQIHSVKRKVTRANNIIFDVDDSEKHHADKFWAMALAVAAISGESSDRIWIIG